MIEMPGFLHYTEWIQKSYEGYLKLISGSDGGAQIEEWVRDV